MHLASCSLVEAKWLWRFSWYRNNRLAHWDVRCDMRFINTAYYFYFDYYCTRDATFSGFSWILDILVQISWFQAFFFFFFFLFQVYLQGGICYTDEKTGWKKSGIGRNVFKCCGSFKSTGPEQTMMCAYTAEQRTSEIAMMFVHWCHWSTHL